MKRKKRGISKKNIVFIAVFLAINILTILIVGKRETAYIAQALADDAGETQELFREVMDNYERSFQIFVQMMAREIENNPDPDDIWDYLKSVDPTLLEIEGETFDGLYMYYQGRYLYSWDTPYSEYEETGYDATERPWYKGAVAGKGKIVFTPPYMSYANHYILTTISQLQPDGETVFAYDIKMGDIQNLVSQMNRYAKEQVMIYDSNGTVIGSTDENYLGGNLFISEDDAKAVVAEAKKELSGIDHKDKEKVEKANDKVTAAEAFYGFRQRFDPGFQTLQGTAGKTLPLKIDGEGYYGHLLQREDFNFLILIPKSSIWKYTVNIWLIPLLVVELLLIYILGRISKEQKNRELKAAYVELGQTQKRLEIALSAAQKAAAIDDLTGMMNFKSFRKEVTAMLDSMESEDSGILIMIDGDHFKLVNDNYGHSAGDEVIKLTAQMIIGRIRTVDLASRLHGDEFAILVSNTEDYSVAKRIMEDINTAMAKEAGKRNMPSITLSAGAVIARQGDSYTALSKMADAALYEAKKTHNGGFAHS